MANIDLAASVAIIQDNCIFLTMRSDVEAWCLPGGSLEPGESIVQAAVREAYEETGLVVQVTRLIGIYYVPHWKYGDNHEILFAAKPVGGTPHPQVSEVTDQGYFTYEKLPDPLLWWHIQRIKDAFNCIGGSVVRQQNAEWPFKKQNMYEKLAKSGLSKPDFFRKYFSKPNPEPDDLDVLLVG
jgi:8-oxo-dGTP pyrophosphatase MutT (NUDIX family)